MQTVICRPPARRRRRRDIRPPVLWAVFGGALLVAALLIARLLLSGGAAPPEPEETPQAPPEIPEWITQDLLPLNDYSRPGTPLEEINGVVVHYVGNPGTTAAQNHRYFASLAESGETYASSHFLIGLDGEILQCVPLDEVAYCSSQRNVDTISIECCHPDDTGEFTPETYAALVGLTQWLQESYGLGRDQILRHYDVTGKECPRYFVRHPDAWEAFLDDLEQAAPAE